MRDFPDCVWSIWLNSVSNQSYIEAFLSLVNIVSQLVQTFENQILTVNKNKSVFEGHMPKVRLGSRTKITFRHQAKKSVTTRADLVVMIFVNVTLVRLTNACKMFR